jgi:hypothetical protein
MYIKIKFQECPLSVVISHYESKQNQCVTFKVKVNVDTLVRPFVTIRVIMIMVIIHKTTLFQRFMSIWNVAAVVEIKIEFHM